MSPPLDVSRAPRRKASSKGRHAPTDPPATRRRNHALGLLALCLLGTAIYSNALDAPFVFDDSQNIVENRFIRWKEIDLDAVAAAAFRSHLPNRPVANLSFALNYYLGGYDVTGYHVANLAVHLANGVLVYLLTSILLERARPSVKPLRRALCAWFAAAAFVAHPLQTQSVTYVVQRMNSLAAMFYLLALLLYLVGRGSPVAWKRWSLFGGGLVSWGLALGSKEIAATLPIGVLLCEWFFFQGLSRRWLRRHLVALAGLLAVFAAVALFYLGSSPLERMLGGYAVRDFTAGERLLTQPRVVCLYLSLLLAPLPGRLNLLHDVSVSHSLLDPSTTLPAFLVLAALLAAAAWLAPTRRLVSFGILWIFLHLAIESSLIPLEMVFEHRMYLPMAGFALLLADPLSRLSARGFARAAPLGLLAIAALAAASAARNQTWRDEVALWEDVVAKYPESHRAHNNLGLALERQGRRDRAIRHYTRALELEPQAVQVHNNLGHALAEVGRREEALRHFERALRLKPDNAAAHTNMGIALVDEGRISEALRHYAEALRIDPDHAGAHYNLAIALEEEGRTGEAIHHYREALRTAPDFARAHNNLGRAFSRRGDPEGAVRHFREALRIDPEFAEAHNNLGLALAHRGDFAGALGHYGEALRIRPDYATAHNNLGVTLARQGRLAEAAERFEQALRLEPDYDEARKNLVRARRLLAEAQ